jgi:hypothetical protein
VTDGDHRGERDPLLVRPFVLRDSGALDDEEPTQTWPASATPRQPAVGNDDAPTAILRLRSEATEDKQGTAAPDRRRRRLVVMAGAGTAVILGAAAAGFAALRDDVRPTVSTGLPGGPVPAATAPLATSASAALPPGTSATVPGRPGKDDGDGTTPTKRSGTSPATTSKPATTSPSAGQPIALNPSPGTGGSTTATVAPAPPTAGERVGVIRGQNSLCLDLFGGLPFDGNYIQVFGCNESTAQTFTLATDGTLRVLGKCASAGEWSVRIVRCDGRASTKWRLSGQRIINESSDDCLTDPSGGRRAGSGVRVTDCDGSAAQRWSLP